MKSSNKCRHIAAASILPTSLRKLWNIFVKQTSFVENFFFETLEQIAHAAIDFFQFVYFSWCRNSFAHKYYVTETIQRCIHSVWCIFIMLHYATRNMRQTLTTYCFQSPIAYFYCFSSCFSLVAKHSKSDEKRKWEEEEGTQRVTHYSTMNIHVFVFTIEITLVGRVSSLHTITYFQNIKFIMAVIGQMLGAAIQLTLRPVWANVWVYVQLAVTLNCSFSSFVSQFSMHSRVGTVSLTRRQRRNEK